MNKLKNIINILKYRRTKMTISDNEYYNSRMKTMVDNIAYWKSHKQNDATLDVERDFCEKMIDIYFKRFLYYKNKIN